MFNLLKKEYNRLLIKQFRKAFDANKNEQIFKDVIIDHIIKMGWNSFIAVDYNVLSKWREYYYQNIKTINEKLEKLYKNLDEKSVEYGKLFFNRSIFVLPSKNEQDFLMMNTNLLFTEEEKALKEKLKNLKSKYTLVNDMKISDYIEYNKHGFKFVEDFAKKYVENKDFIDAGAFVGDSALVLNELNPHKIYSFEPSDSAISLLIQNVEKYSLSEIIIPVKKGVGAKNETITFKTPISKTNEAKMGVVEQSSLDTASDENTVVKTQIDITTIDSYVFENNLQVGLIKLDTDNMEYNVILGAKETIQKQKPILLISVYHTLKDFLDIKPLIEEWSDYNFLIRPTRPDMLNTELMLIAYPKELKRGN